MAQTQTRPRPQQQRQAPSPQAAQQAPAGGQLATIAPPRLPYPPQVALDYYGIDKVKWRTFVESTWPGAKTVEGVLLALDYCHARRLDPVKKPVHIVPIWDRVRGREVESVWPGINEVRTTAARTGLLAGWDQAKYGPMKKANLDGVELEYPEWAQVTVYRLDANGNRQAYPGPEIYWREYYATAKRDTLAPNEMWRRKTRFMLWKCAEAAALRAAFPEELGNQYAAEEMWGKVVDHVPSPAGMQEPPPPRPRREDFPEAAALPQPQEPQFTCILVDLDGEEHDYDSPAAAIEGLEGILRELARRAERATDADERRRMRDAIDASAENNAPAIHVIARLEEHRGAAQALVDRWHELVAELAPFGLKPATTEQQQQGPRNDAPDRSPPAADGQQGNTRGAPDFWRAWNAIAAPPEGDRHECDEAMKKITDLLATATPEDLARPLLTTPLVKALPDQYRARIADTIRRRNAQLKGEAGNG